MPEFRAMEREWRRAQDRINQRWGVLCALVWNPHVAREHRLDPREIFPKLEAEDRVEEKSEEIIALESAYSLDSFRLALKTRARLGLIEAQ